MKQILVFFLFLYAGSSLFALDNISVGVGAEANANTREGIAAGGVLSLGIDINKIFSAGLNTAFSHDFDTVLTIEPRGFFRYYLPLNVKGLFAQAELGTAVFLEDGKAYPAFSAGIAAGWRFLITEKFYIEPYIRGGYPFIFGIGVIGGIRLSLKGGIEE